MPLYGQVLYSEVLETIPRVNVVEVYADAEVRHHCINTTPLRIAHSLFYFQILLVFLPHGYSSGTILRAQKVLDMTSRDHSIIGARCHLKKE